MECLEECILPPMEVALLLRLYFQLLLLFRVEEPAGFRYLSLKSKDEVLRGTR